jgi:hypothetical protein
MTIPACVNLENMGEYVVIHSVASGVCGAWRRNTSARQRARKARGVGWLGGDLWHPLPRHGHLLREADAGVRALLCYGTWARVTVDHCRHLALQNV